MEVEVCELPGARDCFAALPLSMIDALQSRQRTHMFKAVLELRSSKNTMNNEGLWYLAWAGAASSSSSIEISKRLADSVGLPCGARFRVRALRDVAHAETVEVEPATENDWEILELNAGFVEDHILSQVGVLCSGQRFPIWVEGGNVLMLHVIGTKPRRVVQLVPGSELVVAPKLRKVFSPGVDPIKKAEESLNDTSDSLQDKVGSPESVTSPSKRNGLEDLRGLSLSSLTWLEAPASLALERLQVSLSPELQAKCYKLGLPSPGYVLLHGPPACGKTKLALAIANELERNSSILCHRVMVKCAELVGEQTQVVRAAIREAVLEGVKYAPSLIVLDDLDMVIPANQSSDSSEPSTSSVVLAEYLSDLLDTFRLKRRHQCDGCVSFLALAKEVSSLPASLCSSGRFDLHIALSAPTTTQRAAILSQELENRSLGCLEEVVSEIASKCDGYDAADLEVLVDRAVHAIAPRLLNGQNLKKSMGHREQDPQGKKFHLVKEDFEQALDGFSPVSMRDLAKPSNKVGPLTWKDVGGLNDTCRALQEMLELPVKYSKIFSKAPSRLRTGVLLYGPPGCGKTHVVGIAAAACSLRLISVKGPEILNKYIGASEQGVRDLFAKASAAAPCILFFDEFDAIAPKRGHDNTGVTDRVVNQLLTELDGVEALNGVFVFASTSRPDLLDAALLRPGRLDRLLLCDFPTTSERLEILQVLSHKLPLADDVRLDSVASLTENFSGADLQAVLSDAQLEAVHSFLSNEPSRDGTFVNEPKQPIITMAALSSVLLKARPSVSDQERRRLYSIYESFRSSRSSMTDKARDAKGKRATLA
ncbi:hypothetical protein GOP47_0014167 [Adiantum capillus-veneris]|nr:hypothetical protein GOP47_0014167 [Adiantum capillus-veneris]